MRTTRTVTVLALVAFASALLVGVVAAQRAIADDSVDGYFGWTRLNPQRNFIHSAHDTPKDVYVNDVGVESARGGTFPFPEGSVLVKEIIDEEAMQVAMVAAMRKVAGFDAENNDWQYAMFERQEDGTFAGDWVAADHDMHAMCSGCHAGAAATDYAFLNYLGE